MDKTEIQRKIDSISADRDALERTRNKLTGDIALLLQQIAEAKNPKLGHGDFGMDKNNKSFVATQGELPYRELEPYFQDTQSDGCDYAKNNPGDYTIFGNIFNLLKNDEFLEMIATLKIKQS